MPNIEDYSPFIKYNGFILGTVASFAAAVTVSAALTVTGVFTGATGVFSGQVTADTVSTSKVFTYGTATIGLGSSGQSVSSVPLKINGVVGEDITATSVVGTATSTIFGLGSIQFTNPTTGTTSCAVVGNTGVAGSLGLSFRIGDCLP